MALTKCTTCAMKFRTTALKTAHAQSRRSNLRRSRLTNAKDSDESILTLRCTLSPRLNSVKKKHRPGNGRNITPAMGETSKDKVSTTSRDNVLACTTPQDHHYRPITIIDIVRSSNWRKQHPRSDRKPKASQPKNPTRAKTRRNKEHDSINPTMIRFEVVPGAHRVAVRRRSKEPEKPSDNHRLLTFLSGESATNLWLHK